MRPGVTRIADTGELLSVIAIGLSHLPSNKHLVPALASKFRPKASTGLGSRLLRAWGIWQIVHRKATASKRGTGLPWLFIVPREKLDALAYSLLTLVPLLAARLSEWWQWLSKLLLKLLIESALVVETLLSS